jgi:hypothetical protein
MKYGEDDPPLSVQSAATSTHDEVSTATGRFILTTAPPSAKGKKNMIFSFYGHTYTNNIPHLKCLSTDGYSEFSSEPTILKLAPSTKALPPCTETPAYVLVIIVSVICATVLRSTTTEYVPHSHSEFTLPRGRAVCVIFENIEFFTFTNASFATITATSPIASGFIFTSEKVHPTIDIAPSVISTMLYDNQPIDPDTIVNVTLFRVTGAEAVPPSE